MSSNIWAKRICDQRGKGFEACTTYAADDSELGLLENRDYCQAVSLLYILGRLNTPKDVCEEIGLFLEFVPCNTARLIVAFFEWTEQHLLRGGWYEVMASYQLSGKRFGEVYCVIFNRYTIQDPIFSYRNDLLGWCISLVYFPVVM